MSYLNCIPGLLCLVESIYRPHYAAIGSMTPIHNPYSDTLWMYLFWIFSIPNETRVSIKKSYQDEIAPYS